MRVFVVSAVFPPEPIVSSQTSAQVAQAMVANGHDVTVVTAFPSRPSGKLYPGYSRRLFRRERKNGYKLIRCFASTSSESSVMSRFLENISFGLTSGLYLITCPRPDVIYSNTWPVFATFLVFAVAQLRRVPLVISVQDMYPESLISQQRIRASSLMARWMYWLDGIIARGCAKIVVISGSFAEYYRQKRKVSPERLFLIPNWIDDSAVVEDRHSADEFRDRLKIPPDAFLLVYGGNVGMAAGVETLVQSFKYLERPDRIYLLIAGEGSQWADCQKLAAELHTTHIKFHSPWRTEDTSAVLCAASVLILPTRGSQSLASVPSKLIAYMLAGRPVLAVALAGSDLADTVERAGCGWVVESDQPDMLANKINEVANLPAVELTRRGQAGRDYALKNFTGEACLPQVIRVLEQTVAS